MRAWRNHWHWRPRHRPGGCRQQRPNAPAPGRSPHHHGGRPQLGTDADFRTRRRCLAGKLSGGRPHTPGPRGARHGGYDPHFAARLSPLRTRPKFALVDFRKEFLEAKPLQHGPRQQRRRNRYRCQEPGGRFGAMDQVVSGSQAGGPGSHWSGNFPGACGFSGQGRPAETGARRRRWAGCHGRDVRDCQARGAGFGRAGLLERAAALEVTGRK
mmetsp:Transcript_18133/g.45098  ORF Transcript_18133/g.45098 Transcript_18133/m.45098 type:complete len:213 (+) Transcript_18133:637-1275(+)